VTNAFFVSLHGLRPRWRQRCTTAPFSMGRKKPLNNQRSLRCKEKFTRFIFVCNLPNRYAVAIGHHFTDECLKSSQRDG
jgi:hypothetical protein